MARKKGRSSRSDAMPSAIASYAVRPLSPSSLLDTWEDRRNYHPEGPYRAPLSFNESPVVSYGLTNKNYSKATASYLRAKLHRPFFRIGSQTKAAVAFANPKTVWICVRRKARREVLHALNKAGGGRRKRPRRSAYSKVSC